MAESIFVKKGPFIGLIHPLDFHWMEKRVPFTYGRIVPPLQVDRLRIIRTAVIMFVDGDE